MSELANIRARVAEHMPEVRWKREEIAVIETAIADRREQIRILGQTGALTDTSAGSAETSLSEIRALYDKVAEQLDAARADARDLNRRRVELDAISKEVAEAQELLEETRRALEVIVVESGRALPGFTALMSPPSEPAEPSDDNRKLLAAGGLAGGAGLALFAALALGLAERRLRFAETLAPVAHLLPVVQVSAAAPGDREAADRLRNEIQLRPLRAPRLARRAPVIAVVRPASGASGDLARALAESYARARMRTLLIDADLGGSPGADAPPGLRDVLADGPGSAAPQEAGEGVFHLPAGRHPAIRDDTVAAPAIRAVIDRLADGFDAVIVSAGSLEDRLASRFVLAAADIAVADVRPSDPRATVLRHAERLDGLPRHGAVAVLRDALPGDPWTAIRS
jgi:Mrp family chromosome partitioning ATPase